MNPKQNIAAAGGEPPASLYLREMEVWTTEKKNRNILLALIGIIIVAAVFCSFGLPFFSASTPSIVLPAPQPSQGTDQIGWGEAQGIRVDVTPETVQGIVEALNRQESYMRTITTTLEGAVSTATVWADGGWVRTDLVLAAGGSVHTIVGDGGVWRWYGASDRVLYWSGDAHAADADGQRIPTYEDVLELNTDHIMKAGYEEKNGLPCVYAEVLIPELEQIDRYWISADNGLLEAAETEVDGEIVWTMSASEPEIPAPNTDEPYTLPDGIVLHRRTKMVREASDTIGEG